MPRELIPPVHELATHIRAERQPYGMDVIIECRALRYEEFAGDATFALAWLALTNELANAGYDVEQMVKNRPAPR